jgi:hypothetical protein
VSGIAVAGALAPQLTTRLLFAETPRFVERDVCIIGGGSAGTYTAVRLGDLGKSVLLVERSGRLGGHAQTFVDRATGVPIDIGVVDFENIPLVQNYFNRFNVESVLSSQAGGNNANIDLRSGLPLTGYTPPSEAEVGAALYTYFEILSTRYPYLDAGFQLPEPVPAELTAPFSTFVTTYGLQALVPTIFEYNQGAGDLLQYSTLYVLKLFSLNVVASIFAGGFLNIPKGTVQLYEAATKFLGSNVLFNASVGSVDRSGSAVELLIDTPEGRVKVRCGKLVWAAPPTLRNLAPLNLDSVESRIFSCFQPKCYTTGVIQLSGLPAGLSITNLAPDTPYNLPPLPGLYGLEATTPDLYLAFFGSENPLPDGRIRESIRQQVESMAHAGTYPVQFQGFDIFSNHTPFQMHVSGADIASGFYSQLNALQGRHNTFYNGAALQTNDSSLIWRFTEELLPQIVA